MDAKDLGALIGKPQMARLKQVGSGIRVGQIMGARILVKTVVPKTALDDVERKGLIAIPDWVKKDNTPLPTTGVVLMLGPEVPCTLCGHEAYYHRHGMCQCDDYTPLFAEGDMVMFPKFSGSDFNIENEDLRILESKEVMCKLVDTDQSVEETNAQA